MYGFILSNIAEIFAKGKDNNCMFRQNWPTNSTRLFPSGKHPRRIGACVCAVRSRTCLRERAYDFVLIIQVLYLYCFLN